MNAGISAATAARVLAQLRRDPRTITPASRATTPADAPSDALPLTYAFDALKRVTVDGTLGDHGALDITIIAGATLLALALGTATLRRRTP